MNPAFPGLPDVDFQRLKEAVFQCPDDAILSSHFHLPQRFVRSFRRQIIKEHLAIRFNIRSVRPEFAFDPAFVNLARFFCSSWLPGYPKTYFEHMSARIHGVFPHDSSPIHSSQRTNLPICLPKSFMP
jgi:hypothetical protein